MRQSVSLTGLGLDAFEKGVGFMEKIFIEFFNRVPEGQLAIWQPNITKDGTIIDTYAKYFTQQRGMFKSAGVAFASKVDPEGVLQGLCDNEFVHTEDNSVQYLTHSYEHGGSVK